MKIGLLGVSGEEPSLRAWGIALERAGVPFEELALADERQRRLLIARLCSAGFQALILASGDVLDATVSSSERHTVEALERMLGIRSLVAYAYPTPAHGLRAAASAGPLDGLNVALTERGRDVFPYLHGPLAIDVGSWGYLAVPLSSERFEALVSAPDGSALLGIHRLQDGREQMIQTFAANAGQAHAQLLRHGQLRWVTRGTYLGLERNYLSLHVDDVLLANHSWNVATHSTDANPAASIRMSADDVSRAARWSRSRGLRLDLVCNGAGSASHRVDQRHATDPLLDALLGERETFGWINHTYSHVDLDAVPRATIETEIERNVRWARRVGIELEPRALVTGAHTGLANLAATPPRAANPELASALDAQRIRFIACDASRPYPPSAGAAAREQASPGTPFWVGPALAIPRHPSDLPFDAATTQQAVDRLRRQSSSDHAPRDWQQLVSAEAWRIFIAVIGNDPRPHYFHQSNLVGCAGGDPAGGGLLYELIDAVLHQYHRSVGANAPIVQPSFGEIGRLLLWSTAWRASLAAGSISAHLGRSRVTIVNRARDPVHLPLTGAAAGARYGGTRSAWILARPGATVVALEPRLLSALRGS